MNEVTKNTVTKNEDTKITETKSETKTRVASQETVLKQSLRAVRRDLVKAEARGEEFAEIKIEMEGHDTLLQGLKDNEAKIKADLIKVLDLG